MSCLLNPSKPNHENYKFDGIKTKNAFSNIFWNPPPPQWASSTA